MGNYAASLNNYEAVEELLKLKNIDVNIALKTNQTAVYMAALLGSIESLVLLLQDERVNLSGLGRFLRPDKILIEIELEEEDGVSFTTSEQKWTVRSLILEEVQ